MNEPVSLPTDATVFIAKKAPDHREAVCTAAVSLGLAAHPVKSLESVNDQHDETHPACLVADIPIIRKNDPNLIKALDESLVETPDDLLEPQSNGPTLIASASILHDVEQAIATGGITFLREPYSREELLDAIRLAITSDQMYQQRQAKRKEILAAIAQLKPRERQVLDMVYDGLPNKTIAKRLDVSERTVESLRSAVFKAMGVHNAVELARLLAEAEYQHVPKSTP